MNPKISIIVPIFKTERFISNCLRSILSQTFVDFELILVNDGSPDNCGQICEEFKVLDSRIITIHKKNEGVSSARNTGLNIAKGEYIIFIDSDDFVEEKYLENLYKSIEEKQVDMAFNASWYQFDEHSIQKKNIDIGHSSNIKEVPNNILKHFIKDDVWAGPCGKLYKREIINKRQLKFPEWIPIGEDYIFNLQYLKFIKTAVIINEPFYYYRKTENSASKKFYNNWMCIYKYIDDIKKESMIEKLLLTEENQKLARRYLSKVFYGNVRKEMSAIKQLEKGYQKSRISSLLNNSIVRENLNYYEHMGVTARVIILAFKLNKLFGHLVILTFLSIDTMISKVRRSLV